MTQIAYKITTARNTTYKETKWGEGVLHTTSGEGPLCKSGWIHTYNDPLIGLFMNPIHGHFEEPFHLWECEVSGKFLDDRGLMQGWSEVRTVKLIDIPEITTVNRVAFGILAAKQVYFNTAWNTWADNWLANIDRVAAFNAADAAYAAYAAASNGATYAAAAYAAFYAAYAAFNATYADAAYAANAAAFNAAYAAAYAATYAAAYAAANAATYAAPYAAPYAAAINFHEIANQAMLIK
jgi:hypothetical protein